MGKGNGHAKVQDAEERLLPVKLTETELLDRGDQMAEAEIKIEQLKLERAAVGTRIKTQVELRAELAHTIESGVALRDVRCVWIEDYAKNVYVLVRQDTGEPIDTRAMTAADRQGKLGLEGEDRTSEPYALVVHDDVPEAIDADTGEVTAAPKRGPKMRTRVANPSKPPHAFETVETWVGGERVDFGGPFGGPKQRKRSAGKSRDITAELKARSAKQRKTTTKNKSTSRHANA